jgi:hypothetical protein
VKVERRVTREDLVRIVRDVVTGVHRPDYCKYPTTFDPHEWVLEAMQRAYSAGRADGQRGIAALHPEAT